MKGHTFERREYKYLVNEEQRKVLEAIFEEHMIPDEHGRNGRNMICNIYYDTPDFRLIRKSLEGPVYKEKMRLRSYGQMTPDGKVFLELKKKYKGVVYKRRISLKEKEASAYLTGYAPLPEDTQIAREIDYFRKFYGNLKPAMYISYDRSAFYDKEDDSLRITFDRDICFRQTNISLLAAPGGRQILEDGQSLMEIKAGGSMPLWLVKALEESGAKRESFSKYGRAYMTILKESKKDKRYESCQTVYLQDYLKLDRAASH